MQEKPVKIEVTKNLTDQEQIVFDAISKKGPLESTELYAFLKNKFAERTIRSIY